MKESELQNIERGRMKAIQHSSRKNEGPIETKCGDEMVRLLGLATVAIAFPGGAWAARIKRWSA